MLPVKTTSGETDERVLGRVDAPRPVTRVTTAAKRSAALLTALSLSDSDGAPTHTRVNGAFKATSGRNFHNYHSTEAGKMTTINSRYYLVADYPTT